MKKIINFLVGIIKKYFFLILLILPLNAQASGNDIVINEIGAYEKNDYEWIEIFNKGNQPVDITDWKFLENQTNHSLILYKGTDLILEPGEYALIAQKAENINLPDVQTIIDSSWSSLNENGEEIGLKDKENNIIEIFTYPIASNYSLERRDYNLKDYTTINWQEHFSNNTAGKENSNYLKINSAPLQSEESSYNNLNQNKSSSSSTPSPISTTAQLKNKEDSSDSILMEIKKLQAQWENLKLLKEELTYLLDKAELSVNPQSPVYYSDKIVINEIFSYSSEEDQKNNITSASITSFNLKDAKKQELGEKIKTKGSVVVEPGVLGKQIFYINEQGEGAQIYMYSKDFPPLKRGDYIEITGTLAESGGELRIRIKEKKDIKILEKKNPILAQEIKIKDIKESKEGLLVKTKGKITEKKNNYLYVDDKTGEIKIYFKSSAGIDQKNLKVNDEIEITGVISQNQDEYRLMPRYQDDLKIQNTLSETNLSSAKIDKEKEKPSIFFPLAIGSSLSLFSFMALYKKIKEK